MSYSYNNSNNRDVKMSIDFFKRQRNTKMSLKRTTEILFREDIDYRGFLDRVEGKYEKGLNISKGSSTSKIVWFQL